MKNIRNASCVLAVAAVIFLGSCAGHKIEMEDIYKYQDSTSGLIPGAASIQAKTEGEVAGSSELTLIIGAVGFYDAPAEKKQEAAIKAGQIALRILGNDIQRGSLVITKELRDHKEKPQDGIVIDMKIDSLKNAAKAK